MQDAIGFLSGFAFSPNKLGYCGKDNISKHIIDYKLTKKQESKEKIKQAIPSFNCMYSFLKIIAESNSLQPLDYKVAEAYWLGNDLLQNINQEKIKYLYQKTFVESKYLEEEVSKKLLQLFPKNIKPHHSFHVLFPSILSDKSDLIVSRLNKCLILPVKTISIQPFKVSATYNPILFNQEENQFYLDEEKEAVFQNPFYESLKEGDLLAVHWDNVSEIISKDQFDSLKNHTKITLDQVNNILKSL